MNNMYCIFVPTHDNQHRKFKKEHHQRWDKIVLTTENGMTIFKPAKGKWINQVKKYYSETMIPVYIGCSEEEIQFIAKVTKTHYQQEAICYFKLGEMTII